MYELIENIKCPYCNTTIDSQELDNVLDELGCSEGAVEVQCHSCDFYYEVLVEVESSYSYWTKKTKQPIKKEKDCEGQIFFDFYAPEGEDYDEDL